MLGTWFYLILELLTLDLWIVSAKKQVSGILKWRGCNQYKVDFYYKMISRYLWIRVKVLIVDQSCERILNSGAAAYPLALSYVFSFRSLPFPLYLPCTPYHCAPIVSSHISRRLVLLFMWEPTICRCALGHWTSQMLMLEAMSKQFVMMEHILFPDDSSCRLSFYQTALTGQLSSIHVVCDNW